MQKNRCSAEGGEGLVSKEVVRLVAEAEFDTQIFKRRIFNAQNICQAYLLKITINFKDTWESEKGQGCLQRFAPDVARVLVRCWLIEVIQEDVESIEHPSLSMSFNTWTVMLVRLLETLWHSKRVPHSQIIIGWPKPGGGTHSIGLP